MLERIDKRGRASKTWQSEANPRQHRLVSCLGTPLHREGVLDSGVYDVEVNYVPQHVTAGGRDLFLVQDSDWHYGLGIDTAGQMAGQDGVVGFGGRQGAHWFRFRCLRAGYLHWPTRAWDAIGGTPDYDRQNLSQSQKVVTIGPEDDPKTLTVMDRAEWTNIWTTPGGGTVDIVWRADGNGLKEDVILNQAAREWIAANRPPTTPATETWFGFVFQVDVSDIPRAVVNGLVQDLDGDFSDDDGAIELRDALDRLLGLMPISEAYSEFIDGEQQSIPLRKRLWSDGGNHYLLVGARVDHLNSLPAGAITFDPTITPSVGASSDDACETETGSYSHTDTTLLFGGVGGGTVSSTAYGQGFRFTSIGIANGDTVDLAYLTLVCGSNQWNTVSVRMTAIDEDNTATFSSGSQPGSRSIVSSYIAVEDPNQNKSGGTAYDYPTTDSGGLQSTLGDAINEVVNRAGWSSGNALGIVNNSYQDPLAEETYARHSFATYDHATYNAPQLTIEYTEAAGGSYDDDLSLGVVQSVSTASVLEASDTVSLDQLRTVVSASQLEASDILSLVRTEGLAAVSQAILEASLALHQVSGLSITGVLAAVEVALTLTRVETVESEAQLQAQALLSMLRTEGITAQAVAEAQALLAMSRVESLEATSFLAVVEVSVALGKTLGLETEVTAEAQATVDLLRTQGLAAQSFIVTDASLLLDIVQAVEVSRSSGVDVFVALSEIRDLSTETQLDASVVVALDRIGGIDATTILEAEGTLALSETQAMALVAEAAAQAGLSLDLAEAVVLSSSLGLIVASPNRTYIVLGENREYVVPEEDRTYLVPKDLREYTSEEG